MTEQKPKPAPKQPPLLALSKFVLKIMPDPVALHMVVTLSGKIPPLKLTPVEQEAMATAKKLRFGDKTVAWEWGAGPNVVLVHGWGGSAAQMAPLAVQVAGQGYRAIALDVTGHGASPAKRTRWGLFIEDITALSKYLGHNVHAFIGHSAGGMTMMAAHHHRQIQAPCYVCICAPSYPFPPIRGVAQRLAPRETVMALFKQHISKQFGIAWADLETSGFYADPKSDLLLVYEERDRFVPHTEGDKLHSVCPGSTLLKTRDYSHQKILTAPELFTAVGEFLGRQTASP